MNAEQREWLENRLSEIEGQVRGTRRRSRWALLTGLAALATAVVVTFMQPPEGHGVFDHVRTRQIIVENEEGSARVHLNASGLWLGAEGEVRTRLSSFDGLTLRDEKGAKRVQLSAMLSAGLKIYSHTTPLHASEIPRHPILDSSAQRFETSDTG